MLNICEYVVIMIRLHKLIASTQKCQETLTIVSKTCFSKSERKEF
jgi:hypothetical protein